MSVARIALVACVLLGCIENQNQSGDDASPADGWTTDAGDPDGADGTDGEASPDVAARPDTGADAGADAAPDAATDAAPPPDALPDGGWPDGELPLDGGLDSQVDAAPEVDAMPDMAVDATPDAELPPEPDAWVRPEACDIPVATSVEAALEAEQPEALGTGDMAFDPFGRVAVIDAAGDLYRMDTTGERELWAESVARTPRGLAYLSTGALVIADSGRGMLQIVYPAGEVRTLVDHMDAPFGLDVDHDDYVYVSEATRGGITRVDPFSGEIERLADGLEFSPLALAFAPDEQTLYISAQRSGAVYAMDRDADGAFGDVRLHATLPGASGEGPGVCGDGEASGLEQCDDGNNDPDDGCTDACTFDPYNGAVEAEGGVYPLEFDDAGEARVIFTTDEPGDIDRFSFTVDEAATVSIHTINLPGDDCSGDTYIALYRADGGDAIAENDDDPLRLTRLCSRLFPDAHPGLDPLPPGDYEITARQYSAQRTEREGNWLVVRVGVGPAQLGDPCGTPDAWRPCPEGSNCGELDGEQVCLEPVCGDGRVDVGEQCDDANDAVGDGCTADCAFDPYNGVGEPEGGVWPLAFDARGSARIVFTTDAPGEVDRFGFTLDAPSDVAIRTVDLQGDDCNGDTYIALYRAGEDDPIAENDRDPLGAHGSCSRLFPDADDVLDDLPAGDYVIASRQFNGGRLEPLGNWMIVQLVAEVPGEGDTCDGIDPWRPCPDETPCRAIDGVHICVGDICGDGLIDEGEVCDDGNFEDGDGCSADCVLDPFNGEVDAAGGIYPLEFDETGTARVIFMTEVRGASDLFEFTLEEETALEILTTDLSGDGCAGDTYVYVYRDGEDDEFARNDDDPTQQRRLCSLIRPLEHPAMGALPAGRYVISIRQFSRDRTELEGNWLIVRPASPVEVPVEPCDGLQEGDVCVQANGRRGICDGGFRGLNCTEPPPDEAICPAADVACQTDDGERGVCVDAPDGIYCHVGGDCGPDTAGAPCQNRRTQGPGVCTPRGGPIDVCQPINPCEGRVDGEGCLSRGFAGACRVPDAGQVPYCETSAEGGAIMALETDACGQIYAADDLTGAVWRIDPAGEEVSRYATLGRGELTALAFEPGTERLFIGGRGGADLLSLPVELPGRPMVLPLGDAGPDMPQDPRTMRCLDIPDEPIEINELNRPRGYHDVAFDDEGWIIGFDGTSLVRVNRQDQLQPYALGLAGVEGLDFLPDGSLVALSRGGLVRIAPNGAQEVLAADVTGYGITVGPDGRIYVGSNRDQLWRIDPANGLVEPYLDTRQLDRSFQPRNIAFDLDASIMYIGSFGPDVFTLTLDENLDPVGEPRYLMTVRPNARYVDGLTVDACGQLYAPNFESSTLTRATPDGIIGIYKQWEFGQYGHNVVFGSGIGGWRSDALYLPQPYDGSTVVEVVVGVEGAVLEPIDIDPPL